MTPTALRAAIASARLRPRMYAQTAATLATALYWMIAGAASDGVDIGPAWGDAYSPANVHAPADAEVCDAAEATVAALWPQGDAPAGDECAAFGAAPLDTPMPPAFVEALAALSPADAPADVTACERTADCIARAFDALGAEPSRRPSGDGVAVTAGPCEVWVDGDGRVTAVLRHDAPAQGHAPARRAAEAGALDLDAIETRANAASAGPWVSRLGPHAIPEVHGPKYEVAFTFYGEDEGENDHADADAAFIAAARSDVPALVARVRGLEAQVAAAQPAPLDFYGALAAVRNGRFVPPGNVDRAQVATLASPRGAEFFRGMMEFGGPQVCPRCQTLVALGDHSAEECEMRRDKAADRDLCPKCGALDLDHACPTSAATVAGEAFAAEHPYAAAGIMGSATARREDDHGSE